MNKITDYGPVLHTEGDLLYTVLTAEREQEAFEVIVEGFADEPGSIHMEQNREERHRQASIFASMFSSHCARNGMSVVCIDTTSNTVAGVFYARDLLISPPENFDISELPCIAPSVGVVEKLEEDYFKLRPGLSVGNCIDLWLLAVHPAYRRRGIASTLTSSSIDWVSTQGYNYVILESSGGYSAKCAAAAGMTSVIQKNYADHEPLLAGMPVEHSVMQLWELEVTPSLTH